MLTSISQKLLLQTYTPWFFVYIKKNIQYLMNKRTLSLRVENTMYQRNSRPTAMLEKMFNVRRIF